MEKLTATEARTVEERARATITLHHYIVEYGVKNKMTVDDLAVLIAGLLVHTTPSPNELGMAIGRITSLILSARSLADLEPEGSA